MSTTNPYPDLFRKLLQSKIVMSIKQIRYELAGRPRSSLFRDLKEIECLTSYSHAGQYHSLKSKVKFNVDGLWFYEQACFSRHGTLKNTLIKIISNSPAGMTHKELKTLLHIQVQNPLTHLVKINKLQRRVLAEQIMSRTLSDAALNKLVQRIQEKIAIFRVLVYQASATGML